MRSAAVSLAIMCASIGLVASSAAALHAPPPAPGDSGDTASDTADDDTGADDTGGDTGTDTGVDTGTDTGVDSGTIPDDSGLVTEPTDTGDDDLPDIGAAKLAGEKGGFGCSATLSGATAALAWTGLLVVAARGRRRDELDD